MSGGFGGAPVGVPEETPVGVPEETPVGVPEETPVGVPEETPLFTFGLIADIQFADQDDGSNFARTRTRYYRSSLQLLHQAQLHWSDVCPEFVLQLGDIIDGVNAAHGTSLSALRTILSEFSRGATDEVHHVWGNHELYNFTREELLTSELNSTLHVKRQLGACRPGGGIYAYSFSPRAGFTFVVLDAYDVSLLGLEETNERYQRALRLIRAYNSHEDLNSPPSPTESEPLRQRFAKFNGGFSSEQLDWLHSVLMSTDERDDKVTIVSHLPVHPDSTDPACLAWNHSALLSLLRQHHSVVLFVAGHDHDGGYHLDPESRVHHLTLAGVIETPPHSQAFGSVAVYADRMELTGHGRILSRVLDFPETVTTKRL